ncbi:MAG: hypothetical protein ACFB03_10790 [Paracoccaceae bacterium]
MRKKSQRRNEVAHGHLVSERRDGEEGSDESSWIPHLQLSAVAVDKEPASFHRRAKGMKRLMVSDLHAIGVSFRHLANAMLAFVRHYLEPIVLLNQPTTLPIHEPKYVLDAIEHVVGFRSWTNTELLHEVREAVKRTERGAVGPMLSESDMPGDGRPAQQCDP